MQQLPFYWPDWPAPLRRFFCGQKSASNSLRCSGRPGLQMTTVQASHRSWTRRPYRDWRERLAAFIPANSLTSVMSGLAGVI